MKYLTKQLDASIYADNGYYCNESFYQYIYKKCDRYETSCKTEYVIGAAGCDGILFGYKINDESIYAYYPIEKVWIKLADGFNEFIIGWNDGRITV
jgi:hypothetical protein